MSVNNFFFIYYATEQAVVTAILAIIGRFCVNITFNIGLQYGAELIPTAVRAQGIVSYAFIYDLDFERDLMRCP